MSIAVDIFDVLYQQSITLLGYFADSSQRVYWLYLIGALMPIYLLIHLSTLYRGQSFFKLVLSPRIWWHRSARQDYIIFIVNRLLRALVYAPLLISMVPIAVFVSDRLETLVSGVLFADSPQWVVVLCFTTVLFIFDDFSRFLLHYLSHKIPVLWDFHKVHHSALVLTPITVYRIHPLESFLYATRMALAQGVAVGISFVMFGTKLHALDILGANAFVFVFNIFASNLRHSHIWLSWGGALENVFISPAQHQIHHSQNPQYYDCNFGSALAIWDKLFGCLVKAPKQRPMLRFGTKDGWHRVSPWRLYWLPVRDNLRRVKVLLTARETKKSR